MALLAILLLGFALRLYQLGAESLWYDETVSVVLARKSIPDLLAHTAGDIHPPGYYLLLHFWQRWTQPTLLHGLEFLFAWPSLWFGLLIVALLYPISRVTGGAQTALLTSGLAAINPFHLWYSQEVRMYTLAATLGLLCLWSMLRFGQPARAGRLTWLGVYLLAAAAGLYTLYYFSFLLIPLNLMFLALLWFDKPSTDQQPASGLPLAEMSRPPTARRVRAVLLWSLAQVGVLALWAPWLPIFWRQAVDPPVPPWRMPWQNPTELAQAGAETLATLLVGQSPPGESNWPWAVLALAVLAYSCWYVKGRAANVTNWRLLVTYTVGPILLIYLLTLTRTPLYHVRYLFTYAPPLLIFVAAVLLELYRRQRVVGGLALAGLVVINGWSLQQFWAAPFYRADDHRGAVQELAARWRPGDVILVNAGWAYTTLLTYWPTEVATGDSAVPPALGPIERLTAYAGPAGGTPAAWALSQTPLLVRAGSVDGSPRLGWGDPRSDFFAVTSAATSELLRQLSASHSRIWHYRLYDTVSDPPGVIRSWLAANTTLLLDRPVAGRDYLRLQLYQTAGPVVPGSGVLAAPVPFAGQLTLTRAEHLATAAAGSVLYVPTQWQALPELAALTSPLAFSLRLYDAQGQLLAQQDEAPLPATTAWLPNAPQLVTLALPIPVASQPAVYQLQLVVYPTATGQPLAAQTTAGDLPILALGEVQVTASQQAPLQQRSLATFDYLDLLAAAGHLDGTTLAVNLVWQPQPQGYSDTYLTLVELHNAAGAVVQRWQEPLGGWRYPSGMWPPQIPVRDRHQLPLAAPLSPGSYTVWLTLLRDRDQVVIPAKQGWWPLGQSTLQVAELTIDK